jgi:glyoxylase-like metal-dependent hydrolase (beta-lactamase superfamily II)
LEVDLRPRRIVALALALPFLFVLPLGRLAASEGEGLHDASARAERIAEGVYAILHDDAIVQWPSGATGWPHGNTGVVIGDDSVLVIDSTFLPSRATADIALIRKLTPKPVGFLVNTHWHMDHTMGNAVYKDAYPGLVIVGPRASRDFIAFWQERWPRFELLPESPTRAEVKEEEGRLAKGEDAEGKPIGPESRKLLERALAQTKNELAELSSAKVAAPERLFDEELQLDLGGRHVEIRNRGRANSPADVTVYLPREKVLFAGDILVHPVPYAMGAYPVAWLEVLRTLETLPLAAIVPGHGPVFRDDKYLRQVRGLIEATLTRVKALALEGRTVAEIKKSVDLQDLRPAFVLGDDPTAVFYWDYSIKDALVERAYRCLGGAQC